MKRFACLLIPFALLACGGAAKLIPPSPRVVVAAPQEALDTLYAQGRALQEQLELLSVQADQAQAEAQNPGIRTWGVTPLGGVAAPLAAKPKALGPKQPDPLLTKIANQAQRVDDVLRQAVALSQQIQYVSAQIQAVKDGLPLPQPPPSAVDQYGFTGLIGAIATIIGFLAGRFRRKP